MKQVRRNAGPIEQQPPSWFGALVDKFSAVWPDTTAEQHAEQRRAMHARTRHSAWTIALHWLSVLAIVVAATAALSRELTEDQPARTLLMTLHRQAGLVVIVALGLRLLARLSFGMKDFSVGLPLIMKLAAKSAHVALYATLLALPLLGWAVSNAHGVGLSLFGALPLPNLVQEDSDLADTLTDWHVWVAWALLGLVAMHIAAALWHHLARRDGVLSAMLPMVKSRSIARGPHIVSDQPNNGRDKDEEPIRKRA
jgi:cytochrome b561